MPKKVLFVCYSNRARSVVAEYLFRKMLWERDRGLAQGIEVSSTGLGRMRKEALKIAREHPWYAFKSWLGRAPDKYISSVMQEKVLDISKHKARRLKKGWVEEADLIITMEKEQADIIVSRYPSTRGKVFTLKGLSGDVDCSGINDPAGSSLENCKACVDEIEGCLERAAERILNTILPPLAGGN